MYILPKNQVRALADALAGDYELYGPVLRERSGEPTFERVDDPAALRLDAAIPVQSRRSTPSSPSSSGSCPTATIGTAAKPRSSATTSSGPRPCSACGPAT